MSENEFEKVVPETEEPVVDEIQETEEVVEQAEEVEATEETTEEVIEEALEAAEETYEAVEKIADDGEISEEEAEGVVEEIIQVKKKSKAPFVVIAIVIVIAIIAGLAVSIFGGNKYNKLGYANPEGRTITDVAEMMGVSLEEFLTAYSLPADMPGDTEEMAAYFSMPVRVFAEMYGVDYATFKEAYGIPDETTPTEPTTLVGKIKSIFTGDKIVAIDENTPWGIVLDELTLAKYVGEENLEAFKEYYGLGDEVTAETKYKEVKKAVDKKSMQLAQEAKAAEEAANAEEENADVATTDEAPVEENTVDDTKTEETAE